MSTRIIWMVSTVLFYVAVVALLQEVPALRASSGIWRLAHGVLYGAFGAVLLGMLARNFPSATPNAWRAGALLVGAIAAAVGVWATQRANPAAAFDAWMAALLGLSVAVMLPRWLPVGATRRWLAIERRHA